MYIYTQADSYTENKSKYIVLIKKAQYVNIKYIKLDCLQNRTAEGHWRGLNKMQLLLTFHVGTRRLKPSPHACSTRHLGESSSPESHDLIFLFFVVLLLQKYRNKCSLSFSIIASNDNWFWSEDPGYEWGCVSSSITLEKIPKSHFSSILTYKLWKLKSSAHRFGYSRKYHKFSSKRLTIYWSSMCWNCPQIHHLHHHHHDYHHHYIIIPSSPPPY